ncbi:MAG: hypothetical protein ABH864_02935 [archaeon]
MGFTKGQKLKLRKRIKGLRRQRLRESNRGRSLDSTKHYEPEIPTDVRAYDDHWWKYEGDGVFYSRGDGRENPGFLPKEIPQISKCLEEIKSHNWSGGQTLVKTTRFSSGF